MKRRQFIKASAGGVALGLIGGTTAWFSIKKSDYPLTIDAALAKLKALSTKEVIHSGEWNPTQVFTHCAQSVEFSMLGFPEHKSDLFKGSIGKLAFSLFSAKGKMKHNLHEPIPGAPTLDSNTDVQVALNRMISAMIKFKQFDGDLAPHFAYGQLSKQQYEIAHVIHLYNHLQEFNS